MRHDAPRPPLPMLRIPESDLGFAGGGTHLDPRAGISSHGPFSFGTDRHPDRIRIGFVAAAAQAEQARHLLERTLTEPGFRSVAYLEGGTAEIPEGQISSILHGKPGNSRFEAVLDLLEELTVTVGAGRVVVVVVPSVLYQECRRAQPERDLRRALKARLLRHRIPTQLLSEGTLALPDKQAADVGWSLFSSLYFKAGGIPWSPGGQGTQACYLGIRTFRPRSGDRTDVTGVAQIFDGDADGLVLCGPTFRLPSTGHGRAPQLPAEVASELLAGALKTYFDAKGSAPERLLICKTTSFSQEEQLGLSETFPQGAQSDLIRVTAQSNVRLMPAGDEPPLRGTVLRIGDADFVYTTGAVPGARQTLGPRIPAPLLVDGHLGDSSRGTVLSELLALTRMTWLSSAYADVLPITLKYGGLVAEVLAELPAAPDGPVELRFFLD